MENSISLARRAAALSTALSAPEETQVIAFDSCHAFPGILPDMTAAAEQALTQYRTETLQYARRPGVPEMREWVASYLNADGARTSSQEVLMTNSAKHAIELICRLLLDDGDTIVVTAPTYYTAIPLFRSHGATFIEVGQDSEGIDVNQRPANNNVRLNYSHATVAEIEEGVRRLSTAYAAIASQGDSSANPLVGPS